MAEVENRPANSNTTGNAYEKSDSAIDRQEKPSEDYSSPKSVVTSQPISASPPSPASSFSDTRPDTQAQSVDVSSDVGQHKGSGEQPGYEIVPVQKPGTERDAPPSPTSLLSTTGDTRDVLLAKAHQDKVMKYIEAWQVHEKAIIANKYQKEVMKIGAWVHAEKAKVEAKLKKAEAKLEKKKAKIHEQMMNEIAAIQRNGEERKAETEIKQVEEVVKIEEKAARYRATGKSPKRSASCLG
ncbi:hypothetical protein O6H91_20G063900 [Diphasiastrum complanatum]|uniref:Uncharacterized protein n=1 Tax=Diphasiastrum complanatum TaxID=34168 RepID=A0ACC2AR50_DIPCM|nr:hypothetical protein O6H91_20G063900 [Diphasiastrum complanatum]